MASLRVERTYDVPRQRMFELWTESDLMETWWHPGDASWQNTLTEADPRVGGAMRVVVRDRHGTEYGAGGEYTEVDPPRRLAFTWTWDLFPDRQMLVEVDFSAGEHVHTTTVTVTHSGLPDEDAKAGHTEGWRETLANLAAALETAAN
jgi:uncharacterized protein YndB with AHSA1/START domain